MLEVVIVVVAVLLIIVGFWWTRGAGPGANEVGSPGSEELNKFARGKPVPNTDDQIEAERKGSVR